MRSNSAPVGNHEGSVDHAIASSSHQQTENTMPQNLISAEIQPRPDQHHQAALALQQLGFRILHIGPTISVQASQSRWESTFNVSFEEVTTPSIAEIGSETTYSRAITEDLEIPAELAELIEEVMFVEPPEFF
jgi:hypothetical protein